MSMRKHLVRGVGNIVNWVLPVKTAYAHCDIPCGIYDPHAAQVAALTIIRMHQLIQNLERPAMDAAPEARDKYVGQMSRYVKTKEEHAELCKNELRIIWGDYFNATHLQQYPDLHTLIFTAMKQASKCRQDINMEAAQELLGTTHRIAEIFWATKGADTKKQPSLHAVGQELVYPVPKS